MADTDSTGALTGSQSPASAVNPAQSPVTLNLQYPPNPTPTMQNQPSAADLAKLLEANQQYESRLRDLMSQKDRERNEKEAIAKELQSFKDNQANTLTGAAQAAEEAIKKARELEQKWQVAEAQRMKAEALMQHPELTPYAGFIPVTNDPEQLKASIETFKAARERDLAAIQATQQQAQAQQQAQTQPGQPNPLNPTGVDLRALYPQNNIPAMSPARPSPSAMPANPTQSFETELRGAMEEALATGNFAKFEQVKNEVAQKAAAYLQNRSSGN